MIKTKLFQDHCKCLVSFEMFSLAKYPDGILAFVGQFALLLFFYSIDPDWLLNFEAAAFVWPKLPAVNNDVAAKVLRFRNSKIHQVAFKLEKCKFAIDERNQEFASQFITVTNHAKHLKWRTINILVKQELTIE